MQDTEIDRREHRLTLNLTASERLGVGIPQLNDPAQRAAIIDERLPAVCSEVLRSDYKAACREMLPTHHR